MNNKLKIAARLCVAAMAVGIIGIGAQTGEEVYAESDAKEIVSISYKAKTPVEIGEGNDNYGYWGNSKKGEYYKYSIDSVFDKTREGDRLTITYSDNTTKELVAKEVLQYQYIDGHLPYYAFEPTMAFINPESTASEYEYFYDWETYIHSSSGVSDIDDADKYYDYSLEGLYCAYTFGYYDDEDDDVILYDELNLTGKQTFDKRWTGGHTYDVSLEYKGQKDTVPVTIIANEIKSISYKPAKKIKIKAETSGSWEDGVNGCCTLWRTDSEYPEYYEYDISSYFYKKGSKITVTYNNNKTKVYTCKKGKFKDANGNTFPYEISYNDKQNYKTRWKVGKTYKLNLYLGNKKTTFKVKIVNDNSIKNIEFVPKSGNVFKSHGSDAGDYLYKKGNKLIINYKNGKKKIYTCTEGDYYHGTFKDSKGKEFSYRNIGCKTTRYKHPWEYGKTYKATIKCMGKRTKISVKIV